MAFGSDYHGLGGLGQADVGSTFVVKGASMAAGALAGAVAGSVVPVIGTIIGAIIGFAASTLTKSDVKHDTEKAIAGLKTYIADANERGAIAYEKYHVDVLLQYYKYLTDVVQQEVLQSFADVIDGKIDETSFNRIFSYLPLFEGIAVKYTQMGRPYAPLLIQWVNEPVGMLLIEADMEAPDEVIGEMVIKDLKLEKFVGLTTYTITNVNEYGVSVGTMTLPIYHDQYGIPYTQMLDEYGQPSGVPLLITKEGSEGPFQAYGISRRSNNDYDLMRHFVRVMDTVQNFLVSKDIPYPSTEDIAENLSSGGQGVTVRQYLTEIAQMAQEEQKKEAEQAQQTAFELAVATELQKYGITYGQYSTVEQAQISSGDTSQQQAVDLTKTATEMSASTIEALSAGFPLWAMLLLGGLGVSMLMSKKKLKGKMYTKRKKV